MNQKITLEDVPSLLVYGIEQVGISQPAHSISTPLFRIDFEPFDTDKRFHDYDGVIVFQSTFEKIKSSADVYGDSHIDVICKSDELIRRQTQLDRLIEKGGWICFLLYTGFIDRSRFEDFSSTDLCKIYLNYHDFYRESFAASVPITRVGRSEFRTFLGEYGAASTYFKNHNKWITENIKVVCTVNDALTGFILANSIYFVPTRPPKKSEMEDFFTKLGTALVSTAKKLRKDVPVWAEEYRFPSEQVLINKEAGIQEQLEEIRNLLMNFNAFKGALCFESDSLVESVKAVLRNGLGLKLSDKEDEYLEDTVILDGNGHDSVLVEIKGMNENLKSQHIYQADSHRGRRDKPAQFPSLLIANTFMKSSNKIGDKLRDFSAEQIRLAIGKDILIMRTIDLLNLMRFKEQGKISDEQIKVLFQKEVGWLKVSDEAYELRKE